MLSVALQDWTAVRAIALDEIENAHRSVGGSGPGRRYATQHLNQLLKGKPDDADLLCRRDTALEKRKPPTPMEPLPRP